MRGDSYYVSVTGLSWQIPFDLLHSNCIVATIPQDRFIFGADAQYHLLVMRRSAAGPSTPEFDVEVTFSDSMLTQYVVVGVIGMGLLCLLLALARVLRNSDPANRLTILLDFVTFELFLGVPSLVCPHS
jgi:hypothetical protein